MEARPQEEVPASESEFDAFDEEGTWDRSKAVEAGRKGGTVSGQVRRAKAQTRKALEAQTSLAMQEFESEAVEMARIVISAAKGQGEFKRLSPKERAGYALKALEFGIGRPRQGEARKGEEKPQEPGLSFKASPQGDFLRSEETDAVRQREAAPVDARDPSRNGHAVGARDEAAS